ncbi:MAG: phosphotransferase, partial [Planctomycetota bacterium]
PERRLVCRCDTSWKVPELPGPLSLAVILRFERRGLARLIDARASRLSEALSRSDRLRSPRLLFADSAHELVGMECIAGRSLADDVQGEDPIGAVEKAADCLAILHRCGAFEPDDPETQARLRSSDGSVDLLGYSTEDYARQAQEIQQRLKKLAAKTPLGSFGTVHGDFHQEQILIDDDCDWIVDVEWAGYGDTSLDLGSFLGQLTMLEIRKLIPDAAVLQRAFLDRYQQHCGEVNRARLACEEVHMLLELAGKQFRRLKSSWPKRVGKILVRCDEILGSEGA